MATQKKPLFIGLMLVLAMALLLGACVPAQSAEPGQQPAATPAAAEAGAPGEITVIGYGEAFGEPDEAQIQVGVDTFAPTVEDATTQNEAALSRVMAALRAAGIPQNDIQTTNYSLYAEQIYGDRGPEGIAGYRVSNMLNVTIRDITQVGDVLAAVTSAGANSIYGVYFNVADPAALEEEARAAAMANAAQRAASLAELAGVDLGEPIVITELAGQPIPVPLGAGGYYDVVQEAAAPGISPGQLSYQLQVQITYAIK